MTDTAQRRRGPGTGVVRRYPLPSLTALLAVALAMAVGLYPSARARPVLPAGGPAAPATVDLGPVTAVANPVPRLPARFRVAGIQQFTQLRGQPAWRSRALARVARSVWVFGSNGVFGFNTTDVRSDLFPLYGRFIVRGATISFSANNHSVIGASSTFTEMVGTIDFSGRVPVLRFGWANGAGYGAIVNNQRFGATASDAYLSVVTLARF
jgi:hypothetical protein